MVLPQNKPPAPVLHHYLFALVCPDAKGEIMTADDQAMAGMLVLLKDGRPNEGLTFRPGFVGSVCEWCAERMRERIDRMIRGDA